jgi:hypothetical protein
VQRLDLVLGTALLVLFAGCGGGDEPTDTDTETDTDTDTDTDSDTDTDTDSDTDSDPETDCRDGSDNDDDGDADCADSDCASLSECYFMVWTETGTATVTPGTDYTGTASWTFTFVEPADGGDICSFDFDVNDVSDDLASCSGCDFAFTVELTNGRTTAGDCTPIAEGFGLTEGAGGSEFQYGYGFDADYEYGGNTYSMFMYNTSSYGWIAWPYTVSASLTDTTFDYEVMWGYYYYE